MRKRIEQRRFFTLVEMLLVMAVIAILATLTFPTLTRARKKAKFVRWLAFNRACSNDPDCIINFNFQEGKGGVLHNYCAGANVERFNPVNYSGYLINTRHLNNKDGVKFGGTQSDNDNNFQWVKSGGRWGRYKKALKFNGVDTAVVIPTAGGMDFTPDQDFTILCWIKFDEPEFGDTIFSKSLWGTAKDAAAQYDIYFNDYSSSGGKASFDADVFTTCATWANTDVDFEKDGWTHLVLRYKCTGENAAGDPTGQITVFVNGKPLGDYKDTTNENPHTATATGYKACIDHQVPVIIGAAGCYRKYWNRRTYANDGTLVDTLYINPRFHFNGVMDEFLVYKRALTDLEIEGQYQMGSE